MSVNRGSALLRAMKSESIDDAEYIIATDVREIDDDSQYDTMPEYEEHLVEENLVEEYLTEEIDGPDDGTGAVIEEDPFAENDSDSVYTCNACGIEITSVEDHINEFHSDQDVILDIGEKQKRDDIYTVVFKEEPGENDMDDFVYAENDEYTMIDGDSGGPTSEITDNTEVVTLAVVNGGRTNTGKKSYDCSKCNKCFATLRQLSTHVMNDHKKEQAQKRSVPLPKEKPVRKPKKKKLTEGAESAIITEQICDVCNTVFSSAKSLKLHARMHNPIKMKTLEDAAEHEIATIAINNDEYKQKFFCSICDKLYDKAFEEIHVQMHNGEEKFNCGICNKLFPNETNLVMHMNAHQETRVIRTKAEVQNIKLPYACQYCNKEFARPYEKVKHERVHTGEKPYECEICGKCFRVSYCLTIHMRTHTDARPYVCPHCNKRFKAHSVYNHHLLTHSDARNYKCPYCPKSFKTSVQLSGHKNSHTKPFSCTQCNRPFGTLYAVRTHMETHNRPNNNMKHCCEICGAKYARSFALKDHIKEQHKDVQIIDVQTFGKNTSKDSKRPTRRSRASAVAKPEITNEEEVDFVIEKNEFISIEDERELEAAGQSILPNIVEQEITISEINHFETEEEVVGIDWLK